MTTVVFIYKPTTAFVANILFLTMSAMFVDGSQLRTQSYKLDTLRNIQFKFGSISPSCLRKDLHNTNVNNKRLQGNDSLEIY